MALNIKSTPILLGKDAERFIRIVKINRKKAKMSLEDKRKMVEMTKNILQKAKL